MRIKAVNRRAMAKYASFWQALVFVGQAIEEARTVGKRVADVPVKSWQIATAEDIARAAKRVDGSLGTLAKSARRWEAELVSRDWRV
ncbi:MAG: hypothetical protein ACRDTE_03165 [Pseudonocardiaceae bacterium]